MGFPGHFKISGHSGTDFKHRKAFEKIKSYQEFSKEEKTSFDEETYKLPIKSSVPTNYQAAYKQERRFKLFVKLPIFLITIIVIGFVVVNSSNHFMDLLNAKNHQKRLNYKTEKEIKRLENLSYFYNSGNFHLQYSTFLKKSGNFHLQKKELYTAQVEFTEALLIDKFDMDARIGLTETLIIRCQQYNEMCEEAQTQLDFLDDRDFLTKAGIRNLYGQLRIINQE